ncbi:hypothetical protein VIGAN_03209300 [Vigna angularis var. angularis]|uniref:Uncharacterized protein n=1 Tax=Vigna angularis var. angularis TaxID=157739 RepID=A0A0S3RNH2_PHAAN|nr:hypothetical protein VIGAN_03209300 [Vigna angularis var. angularis]
MMQPTSEMKLVQHIQQLTVQPLRSTTSSNKAFTHLKKKTPNNEVAHGFFYEGKQHVMAKEVARPTRDFSDSSFEESTRERSPRQQTISEKR